MKTERESDLAQLLADLQKRSDDLTEQVVSLRVRLSDATNSQDRQKVLVSDAALQLHNLRLLLGLVPAKGEGIEMTISDPQGSVPVDVLIDALQELRDAGADAIEINGRRVVAATWFAGRPGAIEMENVALQAPYIVKAIGSRATLSEAMRIPGGVVDAVQSQTGASIIVSEKGMMQITSLHAAPRFSYATRS
ncbi:MAG: DUF881 domain-containing protein [Actinomycetota bacterium]